MTGRALDSALFRALLRHHRLARGMSQLDLSSAAEVSSRHISFLETGRAQPSREMVLRLAVALGLGLRDTNALLSAAGLPRAFADSPADQPWPPPIERVIARMLEQQEPYPMVVLDARYDVLRANHGATRLMTRFVHNPGALGSRLNVLHLIFHPELLRPSLDDWPLLARYLLAQLQREALGRPGDDRLRALVRELCAYPGVPEDWRRPALELLPAAALEFGLTRDGVRARFLTTLTAFNAPLDAGLEDVRFESYFPLDDETEALCRAG